MASSVFSRLSNIQLPQRLRGGMIEKGLTYWKNIFIDYKMVFEETIQDMRNRPVRASIIGAILVSMGYAAKHNPKESDYVDQLIETNNKLARVPEVLRRKPAYEYIDGVLDLYDKGFLRHQSLGLFSVIYVANYNRGNELFQAQCDYLKPSWRSYITERIVDVGFLDQFHWMQRQMVDYDISETEYGSLK